MRRRSAVIAALAAGTVLVPAPVWAYWNSTSTSPGAARAGSLAAPAITVAMNGAAVRISVTTAPPGGPTPTSYRVDRTAPTAATGVCTITGATGFCQDAAPVPGVLNTYRVVGIVSGWTAIGANAPTAGVTPPAVGLAFTVSAPATARAGTTFPITITATATVAGVMGTDPTYTGAHSFTLTGGANSPGGSTPTLPATANFVNGVATVNVTLVAAGSTNLTVTAGARTGASAAITVTSGDPATIGFSAMTSPTLGTVTCPTTTSCTGAALGNDGAVAGQLVLTDVLGNPVNSSAPGWTITFTATQSKGNGAFTVAGTTAPTHTASVPTTGSTALDWSYAHHGNADWSDVLTITLTNGPTTAATITADLHKTNP